MAISEIQRAVDNLEASIVSYNLLGGEARKAIFPKIAGTVTVLARTLLHGNGDAHFSTAAAPSLILRAILKMKRTGRAKVLMRAKVYWPRRRARA